MNNCKARAKYRATKEWKDFRAEMRQKQKLCALCHAPLKGRWNLHHVHNCKTIEEYESHNPNDFLCMCSECHKYCHWIGRKKSTSKWVIAMKRTIEAIGFGSDWIKY